MASATSSAGPQGPDQLAFVTVLAWPDSNPWAPLFRCRAIEYRERSPAELNAGLKAAFACATVVYDIVFAMTTLTIRLDEELERALDRLARTTGRSKSELVREALKRHLAVARFRQLRRRTLPFAEAQGLLTDEEVFKVASRASSDRCPREKPRATSAGCDPR